MDVIAHLKAGNEKYVNSDTPSGNISLSIREETAKYGQKPYAAILSCVDSRVVPEYIFGAGIGELLTIRSAGNMVDEYVLIAIEYAVDFVGVNTVVVMGHDYCGAINAAISGVDGYFNKLKNKILCSIKDEKDLDTAVHINIKNSIKEISKSPIIVEAIKENKIEIVGAMYYSATGRVEFLD